MAVDLHIHSTCSDGTLTPEEIVERAMGLGLTAISITDHDTFAGTIRGARAAAGRLPFIPGIEISVDGSGADLHILGYYADPEYAPLVEELGRLKQSRQKRAQDVLERLNGLGVDIAMDDVYAASDDPKTIARPHIAAALLQLGVVNSIPEAFQRFLRRGRPAWVDRYRVPPQKAIRLVREAGGLPVLAHPRLAGKNLDLAGLIRVGLGGLEAYHVAHSATDTRDYVKIAADYGILVTGGSDSHGPEGPEPVDIAAVTVPDECFFSLQRWFENKHMTNIAAG